MTQFLLYLLIMLVGRPAQVHGERVFTSPDTIDRKTGIRPHGTVHPIGHVRRHLSGGRGGRP